MVKTAELSAKHQVSPMDPVTGLTAQAAHLTLALVSLSLPCLICSITGSVRTQENRAFYWPPKDQSTTPNILVSPRFTSKSTLSHGAPTAYPAEVSPEPSHVPCALQPLGWVLLITTPRLYVCLMGFPICGLSLVMEAPVYSQSKHSK